MSARDDPDRVSGQIIFRVDDCRGTHELLSGWGAEFLTAPVDRGGEIRAFFRDPDVHLVEVWFSIIERQAIHRGTFGSVKDLNTKIRAFVKGWNDRAHPFVWTKTADQVLAKANRQRTSDAAH